MSPTDPSEASPPAEEAPDESAGGHDLVTLGGGESDDETYGPGDEEEPLATDGLSPVNVRNFSVKCGRCDEYQVIVSFRRIDEEWNAYVYECESEPCVSEEHKSRTILEIPADLDEYARRDPAWKGGKKHAGPE